LLKVVVESAVFAGEKLILVLSTFTYTAVDLRFVTEILQVIITNTKCS